MKKIVFGISILAAILIVSCEANSIAELDAAAAAVTPVVTNTTYTKDIAPIMAANCTSCHNETYNQTPYLTTYAVVKAKTDKILCSIDTPDACGVSIMPPTGKMAQAKIDLIKLWKAQGFVQ